MYGIYYSESLWKVGVQQQISEAASHLCGLLDVRQSLEQMVSRTVKQAAYRYSADLK